MKRALLAVLLAPVVAHAAPSSADQADALFKDANALVTAGKYEEACPKFEESFRLDPALGSAPPDHNDGTVERCPIAGCTKDPEVIARDQKWLRGIAIHSRLLYWANLTAIMKLDL